MRMWLVLLLLTPALVGCLTAGDPGQGEPDAPAGPLFNGLSAPEAVETRDNEDGTRTFVFEPTGQATATDPTMFTFPIDARVGAVALNLSADQDPVESTIVQPQVVADVLDHEGIALCGAASARIHTACRYHVPEEPAGTVEWTVRIAGQSTNRGPLGPVPADRQATVGLTLLPPEVVSHGDPMVGTDPNVSFRLVDPGVPDDEPILEEPTIGVLGDGTVLVQGGQLIHRSRDAGATWEDVSPLQPPDFSEPYLEVDPRSGITYSVTLRTECFWLHWTEDAGDTWNSNPKACALPEYPDHPKLAIGPEAVPGTGLGTVYLGYSSYASPNEEVWVTRSIDGGASFLATAQAAGPLHGQMAKNTGPLVADQDGNVVMPLVLCLAGGGIGAAVSHDAGVAFDLVMLDDTPRSCDADNANMGVAVDTEGTFYIVYHRPGEILYVFSTDGGVTWSEPVEMPMGARGAVTHMAAVAGDPGRIAFAYRATPDSAMLPDFVPGWSAWHMYATFVENATEPDPAFTTALVTPPDDPVRRGGICWNFGPGNICPGDTNVLLEFIDAAVGPDGRLHVAYSDACEPPCRMPVGSEDTQLVVAIQEDGPRLFDAGAPWRTDG